MQWHSVGEFFAMGGYSFYVWGSFGICTIAMIIEPLLIRHRRKLAIRQIQANSDLFTTS